MLGEALRLIRVYHDLKQKDAAARLGVSTSYISDIERGDKTPTLAVIQKYATVFDMPVSSIMFFAENLDGAAVSGPRSFVAGKVLALLQFLEARSGRERVDQA